MTITPPYLIDEGDDLDPTDETFFRSGLHNLRNKCYEIDLPEDEEAARTMEAAVSGFMHRPGRVPSDPTQPNSRYPREAYDYRDAWDGKPKKPLNSAWCQAQTEGKVPGEVSIVDSRVINPATVSVFVLFLKSTRNTKKNKK